MKVIHLISGGDTGGAKTHVHSLLHSLSKTVDVSLVCFRAGPFAEEAAALGTTPGIVRIFCGLEGAQAQIEDLNRFLDQIAR